VGDALKSRKASRHSFLRSQSTPLLLEHEEKESRAVLVALAHRSRHAACDETGAHLKKLIESHSLSQSAMLPWPVLLPPPRSMSVLPPHADSMDSQAVWFTQSIWY
jgi:hypothetical protein